MKIIFTFPVYNEELVLQNSVQALMDFCQANFVDDDWQILIADNNSVDQTGQIGRDLAQKSARVAYFFVSQKGRGIALRTAWQKNEADVYCYMDVDLAVALEATKDLIAAIKNGSGLATGSRYLKEAKVERSWQRDLTSWIYRFLARIILRTQISDFQCGFKAISREVQKNILPLTRDNGFFWDTEIMALAEGAGYPIKEVPVNWSEFRAEKRKSTVRVLQTAVDYLSKIWRLRSRIKKLARP